MTPILPAMGWLGSPQILCRLKLVSCFLLVCVILFIWGYPVPDSVEPRADILAQSSLWECTDDWNVSNKLCLIQLCSNLGSSEISRSQ